MQTPFKNSSFVYFSHSTLQVPRVARQCTVALCEAVAELGAHAQIVSITMRPNPAEPEHPDYAELYGIDTPIEFHNYRLPFVSVGDRSGRVAILRLLAYCWHLVKRATYRKMKSASLLVVSARNISVLAMLIFFKRLFYRNAIVLADVHGEPASRIARWVHRHVDGNVCISQHLANALRGRLDLTDVQVRIAHTGVKLERFQFNESREEIARRLHLPRHRPVICYSGKVYYKYQEIAYLLEMAKILQDEITLLIVGGRPDQIPPWEDECRREGITNIIFTGFKKPSEVPAYLRAADLLVMYYSPSPLNDYRSPGKLFEYLASGTPLVASRFRGIEEIIKDGENGFLAEPYRPDLLAAKIRELLANRTRWEDVGCRAVATAAKYTWRVRAAEFLYYARDLQNVDIAAEPSINRHE